MAPKRQLERLAWEWAETTDPENVQWHHVETAYRIHLPACKAGQCRRNCRGNPHCLLGLGEGKWLVDVDDSAWHDIEDPNLERRKEGSFVGLKNLGATCYVNTFLQLWFHNPEFKTAIYEWNDPYMEEYDVSNSLERGDAEQISNTVTEKIPASEPKEKEIDTNLLPKSVCGHLQAIFGLLQFSKRRYVDPTPFINCLGLDTGQQQDAEEFSKLFITLLEDTLCQQSNSTVRNLIQNQFMGHYDYVTRCNFCNGVSRRPSKFYELDVNIKGHKELADCIQEFLKEEKLEGDNRYMCPNCNCKQNATRRICLNTLPPVLNLQLLRFVFDRQSGHKKKLNTYIQFPEMLDMGKYVEQADGQVLYDLTAVLIHRGPSAYSGHYIAHIQDRSSGTWFKFNDEEIEKVAGKNLQLGNEDTIQGEGKKPRTPKGCLASRNAYMLVYRRRIHTAVAETVAKEFQLSDLPKSVQRYIEADNERLEEWIQGMIHMRQKNIDTGLTRQAEVRKMYSMLPATIAEPYEWISTEWLIQWMCNETEESVPPVDTTGLMCRHQRLNPDKVTSVKCVSLQGAALLYAKYGGSVRLKSDILCRECVVERCRIIHTKVKIATDNKLISALLKSKQIPTGLEDAYWVSKASLRSWKKLALQQLEQLQHKSGLSIMSSSENSVYSSAPDASTQPTAETSNVNSNAKSENEVEGSQGAGDAKNEEENGTSLIFNEEILCEPHGNLSIDSSSRRLVPADIWQRLKFYFPAAPELRFDVPECPLCRAHDTQEKEAKDQYKYMAAEQKAALQELYLDRRRPTWTADVNQLNVVLKDFVDEWRRFIREPNRYEPLSRSGNSSLICQHGGFLFHPEIIGLLGATDRLEYIWPKEWEALSKFLVSDVEISVTRLEFDDQVTFIVEPDVCEECAHARIEQEKESQLNYTNAVLFVRKVTTDNKLYSPSASGGSSPKKPDPDSPSVSIDDPEFMQKNGKRKKLCEGPPDKLAKVDPAQLRRSSRHRRLRGEKEVTVSSQQTLRDLKLQIMKIFSVPPFDQNLLLDGQLLTGETETLASLKILPGSTIYFKADEAVEDPTFLDDITKGLVV